ncbi:response regulator [Candidatus Kapabacteria bacterium]|nr:response regulator [Candidatus Kapabacteria bacterium]
MTEKVIICVDDEKIILDSLKTELSNIHSDFTIEIAESGEEALELIDELLEDDFDIQMIISDYQMPEMKGDEFLFKAYSKLPKAKLILLTGQATMEGVTNAVNKAKLYRYISKPWDENDLNLTVSEALKLYKSEAELKQKQVDLAEAFKKLSNLDSAKSYFLGLLSHELNTPLIGINGNAKLIQAIAEDPDIIESVEEILKSESRLRKFADIALLITRLSTNQYMINKQIQTVESIIEQAVFNLKDFANEKQVQIIIDLPGSEKEIEADSSLILKAFESVLHNAIKYSNNKTQVLINGFLDNDKYKTVIRDNGPGIEESVKLKIFELFESDELMSHGEGYGLSLTATKIILDAHDGKINAINHENGAEFIISI